MKVSWANLVVNSEYRVRGKTGLLHSDHSIGFVDFRFMGRDNLTNEEILIINSFPLNAGIRSEVTAWEFRTSTPLELIWSHLRGIHQNLP